MRSSKTSPAADNKPTDVIPTGVRPTPRHSEESSSSRPSPVLASPDDVLFYTQYFGRAPKNLATLDDIGNRTDTAAIAYWSAYARHLGLDPPSSDEDSFTDESASIASEDTAGEVDSRAGDTSRDSPSVVPPKKVLDDREGRPGDESDTTDSLNQSSGFRKSAATKTRYPLRIFSDDEGEGASIQDPPTPDPSKRRNKRVRWTSPTRRRSPKRSKSAIPPNTPSPTPTQAGLSSTVTRGPEDPLEDAPAATEQPNNKRQGPSTASSRKIYTSKFAGAGGLPKERAVLPQGLTRNARRARYRDMNEEQIRQHDASHMPAWNAVPPRAKRAFGFTRASFLDNTAWIWLGPRVYHYTNLPMGTAREEYCTLILEDLFKEFKDLHPDFFQFEDELAELEYQRRLREFIHRRSNMMLGHLRKGGLLAPGKATDESWKLVRSLLFGGKQRTHDLWANQSDRAEELRREYPAYLESVGASTTDMATLQTYRKGKLNAESLTVQEEWAQRALEHNRNPKIPEPARLTQLLLPPIKRLIQLYSKHTGNPIIFGTGAESQTTPGTGDIMMLYLGGRATSDVKNFLSSPGAHGRFMTLAWRQQVADVLRINFEHISGNLDDLIQEFTPPSQPATLTVPTMPYLDIKHPIPQSKEAEEINWDDETFLTPDEVNSLTTGLRDWFKGCYTTVTGYKSIDYGKLTRDQELGRHFDPKCRPHFNGKPVIFQDPRAMDRWMLVAWANHLSDRTLPPEKRFTFIGNSARVAPRGADMPKSLRLALTDGKDDPETEDQNPFDPIVPPSGSSSNGPNFSAPPRPPDAMDAPIEIQSTAPAVRTDGDSVPDYQALPYELPGGRDPDLMDYEYSHPHLDAHGNTSSKTQTFVEAAITALPTGIGAAKGKGKGKEVHSQAEFSFAPQVMTKSRQPGEETILMEIKHIPVPSFTYRGAPVVLPPNFGDLGQRLFRLFTLFPQAPTLMLDHKRWSQEEDRFWTHLNDIHYPIPLASTLPRCAAATPSFLDDLVQRMDHFALQLRESLDKPTDRRPSFHKAIILAARYSFCGAAVARTCRMQATSEEEEVTFRSYNTKFAEKASGLAQLAFVGAALFYYENCGLQASSPILGPQKRLPEDGAALVAAWIRSLRTYSVPQDNIPTNIWGHAPVHHDRCPEFYDPSNPATVHYKSSLEAQVKKLLSPSGRLLTDMPLLEQSRAVASILVCLKHRIENGDDGSFDDWISSLRRLTSRLQNLSSTPKSTGLSARLDYSAMPSGADPIPGMLVSSSSISNRQPDYPSPSIPGPARVKPQLKRKDRSKPGGEWQIRDLARIDMDGESVLIRFVQEADGVTLMRYAGPGPNAGEVVRNSDGSPAEPVPFREDWLVEAVRSGYPSIKRRAAPSHLYSADRSRSGLNAEEGTTRGRRHSEQRQPVSVKDKGDLPAPPAPSKAALRRSNTSVEAADEERSPKKRKLPATRASPAKRARGPALDAVVPRAAHALAARSSSIAFPHAGPPEMDVDGVSGGQNNNAMEGTESPAQRPRRPSVTFPDGSKWDSKNINQKLVGTTSHRSRRRKVKQADP